MIQLLINRINRKQYPKIVQRWSFSAYIGTLVFAAGNKLYGYFFVNLIATLVTLLIFMLNLEGVFFTALYFISTAIGLLITIYLIMYGRVLAWERSGYHDTETDILKFNSRQKKILFWSWVYYATVFALSFYFSLNYSSSFF